MCGLTYKHLCGCVPLGVCVSNYDICECSPHYAYAAYAAEYCWLWAKPNGKWQMATWNIFLGKICATILATNSSWAATPTPKSPLWVEINAGWWTFMEHFAELQSSQLQFQLLASGQWSKKFSCQQNENFIYFVFPPFRSLLKCCAKIKCWL